jgi:TM2 domain-containing membrane protein YozV
MNISEWFFGIKYLITLTIILIILWLCLFLWFLIEEKKYGDDVVEKSGFVRPYYEVSKDNGLTNQKYYANAFSDSIYYATTMFGTFGYGDIYPRKNPAKGFITFWNFIIIIFVMNLYENVFVSNKTIKDLSLNIKKLQISSRNLTNDSSRSYVSLGP